MNVIDMRTSLRRSSMNNESARLFPVERRKADRRVLNAEPSGSYGRGANVHRVWLTPGERALIEDLYLLGDKG